MPINGQYPPPEFSGNISKTLAAHTDGETFRLPPISLTFRDMDYSKIKIHTADEAAELTMQLYDSDAVVGAVQRDLTLLLSDGLHDIGRF